MHTHHFTIVLLLVLASCIGRGDEQAGRPFVVGDDVYLEGRVTQIDLTPLVVDGDAEFTVLSERFGTVLVRIPAGESLCPATRVGAYATVARGDDVRVLGRATGARELTICADEAHFFEESDPGPIIPGVRAPADRGRDGPGADARDPRDPRGLERLRRDERAVRGTMEGRGRRDPGEDHSHGVQLNLERQVRP